MLKKLISISMISFIVCSAPVNAKVNSTEFHGLKLGMTEKQASRVLGQSFPAMIKDWKVNNHRIADEYSDKQIKRMIIENGFSQKKLAEHNKSFAKKEFQTLTPAFTPDGKLWRIQITYSTADRGFLENSALKSVLEKSFDGALIEPVNAQYPYVLVTLVSQDILKEALDKLEKELAGSI